MINKALLAAIIVAVILPLQAYSKTDKQIQSSQTKVIENKVTATQTAEYGFFTDEYIKGTKSENIIGAEAAKLRKICNKEELLNSEAVKDINGYIEVSPETQGKLIQLIKSNDKVYPEATAANYLLKRYESESQYFFAVDFVDTKTVDYHVILLDNSVTNPEIKIFNGLQQVAFSRMISLLNNENSEKFIYKSIEVTMSDDGKFTVSKDTPSLFSKMVTKHLKINNKQVDQKSKSTESQENTEMTKEKALKLAKEYAKNINSYRHRSYVILKK